MARSLYDVSTTADVPSAAAATAKCIIGVKAHANSGLLVTGWWISFDGVTASEKPVLVELMYSTFATNSPGTASTSETPAQVTGRVLTAGFTAARAWTTEPTVLTVLEVKECDPNKGLFHFEIPLGDEPDSALAEGFAIRATVPSGGAAVNMRAGLRVARN